MEGVNHLPKHDGGTGFVAAHEHVGMVALGVTDAAFERIGMLALGVTDTLVTSRKHFALSALYYCVRHDTQWESAEPRDREWIWWPKRKLFRQVP